MDISTIQLVTSNDDKLKEFRRFGLTLAIEKGLDLQEVAGTSEEVVIYKAIEAGENKLVEDTILMIEGEEVVDIRNKIDEMALFEECQAVWVVSLALLQAGNIYVATARVNGHIKAPKKRPADAFGFDAYFHPSDNKEGLSLYALDALGEKDRYSARKRAVEAFVHQTSLCYILQAKDLAPWTGDYQKIDH
jgi:inosine/xanthosine triphosphate pyrophosphatase family protein